MSRRKFRSGQPWKQTHHHPGHVVSSGERTERPWVVRWEAATRFADRWSQHERFATEAEARKLQAQLRARGITAQVYTG